MIPTESCQTDYEKNKYYFFFFLEKGDVGTGWLAVCCLEKGLKWGPTPNVLCERKKTRFSVDTRNEKAEIKSCGGPGALV